MSLLNQDSYFYIETYNNRNSTAPEPKIRHGGWPGTAIRNWDDKEYWYVEFINGDAFFHYPIEKLAGPEMYERIKKGEVTLCISHVHEAYHYVIEDIYTDVVVASGIDPSNILYLTNSADIDKEIVAVSTKLNLPRIKSEFISLFELVAKHEALTRSNDYATSTLSKLEYDKKFISLNGLWRPHRLLLVSLLQALGIRHNGHVSLNACVSDCPTMDEMFPEMLKWCNKSTEATQVLLSNESLIKTLDKLYIDTDNTTTHWQGAVYHSLNKRYYEDTYFSLVTETLCSPEFSAGGNTIGRAISEKTFKPMLHNHPFMIAGVPGVLRLLKKLGYKTFSPMIDESYDDEPDTAKRCYMIAKEAKRLCSLQSNELQEFLSNCKPIVEYNLNLLKSKETFSYHMT
jgi:hypothetical protein